MKVLRPETMHVVYSLHDDAGLFYVGCSGLFDERCASHRRKYGDHITVRIVATFANRQHAEQYERRLIAERRPRENRQANPDYYAKQPWRKIA